MCTRIEQGRNRRARQACDRRPGPELQRWDWQRRACSNRTSGGLPPARGAGRFCSTHQGGVTMNVKLIEQLDLSRDEYFTRRTVIRALASARRRLEDERGPNCCFIDPRTDMLLQFAADLALGALETIEALGAELISERIW